MVNNTYKQPLVNRSGITIKQVKQWVSDRAEKDEYGNDYEVWIGDGAGLSNPVVEIRKLNEVGIVLDSNSKLSKHQPKHQPKHKLVNEGGVTVEQFKQWVSGLVERDGYGGEYKVWIESDSSNSSTSLAIEICKLNEGDIILNPTNKQPKRRPKYEPKQRPEKPKPKQKV